VSRRPDLVGLLRAGWKALGPGFVTGAADDDPSGIATYAIAGASAGYSLLWVTLVTLPMMAVVQEMCARIAIVTRSGLAAALCARFPLWFVRMLVLLVAAANTFNLAADLSGMSAATSLVVHVDPEVSTPLFALLILFFQLRFPYGPLNIAAKVFCLTLFAYVATVIVVHPPWGLVLRHLVVPEFHRDAAWLGLLVGFLGTTITPYLFFWQASQEVEELTDEPVDESVRRARGETVRGMVFSNLISASIVIATAATLGAHGLKVKSAADAAASLRPLAGEGAYLLFALGMVGAGLLAVPVLATSSAYAMAEVFDWREGLTRKPRSAPGFYATIVVAVLAGIVIDLAHVDPVGILFASAVVNGFVAIPLIVAITVLANDPACVKKFLNPPIVNVVAWATVALMSYAAIALVVTSLP
jgi:Mn2+/Fe2+ NRAMP family transporter